MTGKKRIVGFAFMILWLCFMMNLSAGKALAKDAEFTLSIDSLNLEMGVSTNLVLSLVNARDAEVTEIIGLDNFDVLSTGQSTSTQIVNGDMTSQKDLRYIIMPKKTGQFTLQGKVEYNGQSYLTNELQVQVIESAGPAEEESNLFIKTVLSDQEIYPGQKAVLTYELYSRYNIEDFGFLDDITIDGFITGDIPQDQLQAGYVYINGNKYVRYEVKQLLLSPMKTGTFSIPAFKFQVNVSTGDFFSSSKPVYLQTEPLELTVKPLPKDNQPADFSGIVGKLNLESGYSRQELNYGDSLTLNVTASGNCSLDLLPKIFNKDIEGFSVYETQKNTEEGVKNNQYYARKEFEIILVPGTNGEIRIDPVSLCYFDPETGTYERAEIPGTTIMVHGEAPAAQAPAPAQSGTGSVETVKIEQISYNAAGGDYLTIRVKKDTLRIAGMALAGIVLLAAAAILFILRRKKQNDLLSECCRKIMKSDDRNEIFNLFNKMIKESCNVSLKASTRETISGRLSVYGLDTTVLDIQDYLEGKNREADIRQIKSKIKEVCRKLKKHKP